MPNLDNIINETARKEGISLNNLINQAAAKEGINLVPEETAKQAEKGTQIPVQTFETDTVPSYAEEQLKQRGVNSLKDLTAQVDNLDKGKLNKMQQEADAQQAYQKQLEDRGFWTNFKEGATAAGYSALSGGNEFIGNAVNFVANRLEEAAMLNPNPVTQHVAKALKGTGDFVLGLAEQGRQDASKHEYAGVGGDIGAIVPQTAEIGATLIASAYTGGGTGLASGLTQAMGKTLPYRLGMQAGGSTQQEFKDYWESKGVEVTDTEVLGAGLIGAMAETISEKVGFDRLTGRGSKIVSKWLLQKSPEVTGSIVRLVAARNPQLYKKAIDQGVKFGSNAFSEMFEETLTEATNIVHELAYKKFSGQDEDVRAVWSTIGYRMMEAAKGGAMMSAFLSPAQSGATRIRDWKRRQAQGMHMVTDNQNRTFEIIGEEGETLHVMDVNGIETTIKREEVQADMRLSNEEYDLLLDAYKTGKNFEQHEQAHLMKNTQTGRLEMARDTRLDEDEEGGYFVHSRDESTGMATVTDVLTGNKMMIPIAYIDPESVQDMSVEDYVKAQGDPNAAIEPQPDQISNGEMVAGNGFVGVVTDSMPDGTMSVQTQDGQFITTTAQEVKRAKEFVGGLIGVDTGNGWEIGDPTPDREAADKTAATLSQAYPMLTFTIDEIPGADATTPTTYKITATENANASQQEQQQEQPQAPASVSEVLQQAEAGIIPEPEAPRLNYNGKAVPKAFAKAKINRATSREELGVLDTNDAEVMRWIEEKFPTPVPAYSFAGEPVTREEALNIIEAMDESDLQDLQIDNDDELATMVLAKFDRLPEVEQVEQVAPVVEQQVEQPVGELLENKVVNNQVAREEAKVNTEPTEAQKEAGNYKKGHIQVQGLDITIEQPKGSVRKGVDEDGRAWESEMHNTYGYFKRTEGNDGDHVDVFIGENPTSGKVFVVDQVNPKTGEFDEHKVMLGFNSQEEAQQAYLSNYEEGWQGLGAITEMDVDAFKEWVKDETKTTKPAKVVEPLDYGSAKKAVLDRFGGMYQAVAESTPEAIVASVPGVSPEMAAQIHQEVKAEFEATKERTADNDSPFGWQQEEHVPQPGKKVAAKKKPSLTKNRKKAANLEVHTAYDAVMQYFIAGGHLSQEGLEKIFGKKAESERKARFFWISRKGLTPEMIAHEMIAHEIWENHPEYDIFDLTNAVEEIVLAYKSPEQMAIDLLEKHKQAEHPYSEEELASLVEQEQADIAAAETLEQELKVNGLLRYEAEMEILEGMSDEELVKLMYPEAFVNEENGVNLQDNNEQDGQGTRTKGEHRASDGSSNPKDNASHRQEPGGSSTSVTGETGGRRTESDLQAEQQKIEHRLRYAKRNKEKAERDLYALTEKQKNDPSLGMRGQKDIFGNVAGEGTLFGADLDKQAKGFLAERQRAVEEAREEYAKWKKKAEDIAEEIANLKGGQGNLFEPVGDLLERKSQERKKATKPQEPAQEPVQESKAYGADNKVVSADRAAELTKLLRAKIGNLNVGIDPELLALGVELAAFHVEAGARKFSDFCKRMVGDIGDGIKPYLKTVYNAVRDFPGMEDYEATMDEYAAVRGADIDQLLKESKSNENEQEEPASGSAEAAVIETTSAEVESLESAARDAKDRGQAEQVIEGAKAVKEKIDSQIEAVRLKLSKYETADIDHEIPSRIVEKQVKKDVKKFATALATALGYEHDTDKKGKPVICNANIAPAGGNATFILWKPGSEYGVYISIAYEQDFNDDYRIGRIMWRATSKTDKYKGLGNMWASNDITVGAFKKNIESVMTRYGKTPVSLDNEQKKPELESNVESKQEDDGINSTQLRRDVSGTPGGDQAGDVAQDGEGRTGRADKDTGSQSGDGEKTGSKLPETGLSGGRSTGAGERSTVSTGGRSEQQPDGDDGQRQDLRRAGEQRKNQRNNVIKDGDNIIPRGDVAKINANLEAIRIAKQLAESGKQASPAQMEALRRYTGWGGLPKVFKYDDPNYQAVKDALTPAEYEAARRSTTTAFYTPIDKVRAIWRMAEKLGFKGGNVLDPSGGTGHFFGAMPEGLKDVSNLRGVELDDISGLIYKALYPDAHIEIGGYEDAQVANNSQDLIMTNVPFGDFKLHDSGEKALSSRFKIHDFFIAKSVKKLKPGGIGIFITTSSTMDGSQALRTWLSQEGNADVIDAFRLNSDTFKQGAGTEATSDIIIIRKRDEKGKSPHAKDVMGTKVLREAEYTEQVYNSKTYRNEEVPKKAQMTVNSFFAENPDKMGGEMKFGMEGGNELRKTEQRCAPVKGIDQDALLEDFIEQLPANLHDATGGTVETVMNDTGAKEGGLVVKDGKVMIVSNSTLVAPGWNANKVNGKSKVQAVEQYNRIKDALDKLMNEELADGPNIEALRKELNKAYDAFVKDFGTLNNNTKISFLKDDVDFPSIAAIENIVDDPKADLSLPRAQRQRVVKAKIFSERMLGVSPELKAETIEDAFVASNYKHGHLDVAYAAGLLGMDVEAFKAQALKEGVAFVDPATGVLMHKSDYLSGNVVAKLNEAKENNENRAYDANIKALEKVIPMPIAMPVIKLTLGSSWIPTNVYEKFFQEVFGVNAEITRTNADKYMAKQSNTHNAKNQGIEGLKASDLALMAMNNSRATVTYKNADGQTVVDKDASMAAQGKQNEFRELFEEWVKREGQPFREELETIYNETFRAVVNKEESVDHIVRFPGASIQAHTLRTHQKKAVLRALQKSTLFAHEVGTGKTMALITTAMEMRRLGLAKKPAIVVQRSTYKQFVNEIKKLYPNAKVLAPSAKDLTRAEREKLFAKIAYNDWDIVIMYHGYLDGIPDDPDRVRQYIQEKIEEKLEILEQVRDSKAEGFNIAAKRLEREIEALQEQMYSDDPSAKKSKSIKQQEKSKSKAEAKAKKLMDRRTDNTMTFESLGIDALLIDEAHQYKKLGFNTSLQKIKGIDTGASQRAQSAFLKTRYIMERNNGRNVVFATGTPISNTTAELWTFLRYLLPKEELNRLGMGNFDAFVNNFGEVEEDYEFTASGQYKMTERFAKYGNLPELKTIFRQVTHIALTKEIPDLEAGVGVPRMKDDKETQVVIPQTPVLKGVMKSIKQQIEAWEQLPGKEKRAKSHIPIVMFGLAKQAAIDVRLVDSTLPDDPASKLNKAVDLCVEQLEQSKGYKGTVAIFSDSKQSRDKKFNVFEDIKSKLVARGYSADEIAIIDDYNTDDKKEKLFEKVNAGDIRVVLGTTEKLGVGVNIQERLKCLIHMDAPIRPSDYQQRNGRIIRQGNIHTDMNIPVEVIQIGVEKTLDVTGYQRLAIKEAFVKQIMTEDDGTRTMEEEDVDGASGNFTEMMARVSGSQTALLWASTGRELNKLLNAQKYHAQNVSYMASKMRSNEARIPAMEKLIEAEQREYEGMVKLFGGNKMASIEMGKKKSTDPAEFEEFINTHITKHLNDAVEQLRSKVHETTSKLSIPIKINGVECNVVTTFEKSFGLEGQGVRINKHVMLYSKNGDFKEMPLGANPRKMIGEIGDLLSEERHQTNIEGFRESIERAKSENEVYAKEMNRPFGKEAKIKELEAQLESLEGKMKDELAAIEKEDADVAVIELAEVTEEGVQEVKEDVKEEVREDDSQETEEESEEESPKQEAPKQEKPTQGAAGLVEVGEVRHTKTGQMLPAVKVSGRVSSEVFASMKKLAQEIDPGKGGGYYSTYAKRFLFSSSEKAAEFAAKVNGGNERYSLANEGKYEDSAERHAEVSRIVEDLQKLTEGSLPTVVVRNAEELISRLEADNEVFRAEGVRRQLEAAKEQGKRIGIKGMMIGNRTYIVAETHRNEQEVVETWIHENVAHFGLRFLFKDAEGGKAKLNNLMLEVARLVTPEQMAETIGKAYDMDNMKPEALADEYVAHIAEKVLGREALTRVERSVWEKIRDYFSDLLKAFTGDKIHFENKQAMDDYIVELLKASARKVANERYEAKEKVWNKETQTVEKKVIPRFHLFQGEIDKKTRLKIGSEYQFRRKGSTAELIASKKPLNKAQHDKYAEAARRAEVQFGVEIITVSNASGLPQHIYEQLEPGREHLVGGCYDADNDVVYVVTGNLLSEEHLKAVILHEVVGHRGLRAVLGEKLETVLNDVYNSMNEADKALFGELYGTDDPLLIAEEYIARVADNRYERPNILVRVVSKVRELLRELFDIEYSYNDVLSLIARSEDFYKYNPKPNPMKYGTPGEYFEALNRWRNYNEEGVTAVRSPLFRLNNGSSAELSERGDKVRGVLQDRMLQVKRLEQEVSRRGGMVSEFSKAYRQENLSYGRVSGEMARVNKELTTPLMEAVAKLIKQGSYLEAVQRYMKAKHAAERNIEFTHNKIWAERLKELNEAAAKEKWDENEYDLELKEAKKLFDQEKDSFVIDNHSGIEQDDALGIIADFEAEFDTKELWEKKQALSDFVLDRWLQDGFIDRDNYNFQKGRFKHYVPLRGFAEEDNTWEYQNKQMGKILNPNRKAEGRTSESEDPLQYLVNMAHSAIVLGEKNRIKQHIYRLVGENRDMEDLFSVAKVWHVATGEKDETGADIVEERYESPTAAEFSSGMVVEIERNPKKYRIGKSKQEHAEHEVELYINGRKHLVRFENPEVARAINKTNVADVPAILQYAGSATRWLTANFTAKNPAFIPINAIRDVSYSVLSHAIRGEDALSFIGMLRRSQKAIKQFQKGKSTPDAELYKEFVSQGGQTGFIHLKDVDAIKAEVEKEIKRMTGDNNVWDKAMHSKFVGYWGEMMENWAVRSEDMCRFAAYMEARKNGKNNAEAAYAAKEVSVNFNRKGSHSNIVGSLFAFFNASVQGTENFVRLGWEHKGKMASVAAGFAAMGFISALLQALGDDEEDKNSYRNLSPYIRRNYLTICYGKEDYLSIPLPHGFRAFFGLGVLAAEMCYQEPEHALKGAVDLLSGAFSPVDIGAIMKENRKGQLIPSARPFIPTIAVPWFDLANNEDFAGRKIGREVYTKDQEEMMANAGLYQRNVNVLVKGMTDNVYTLFGGDTNIYTKGNIENGQLKRVPWAADWNPSKVEHVLTYYAGGRGKFFNDLMKTAFGVVEGAKNTMQGKDDAWEEFDVNTIPILNRVNREGYGKNVLGQYYRVKDEVDEYYGVLKLKPEWEQIPSPEMEIKKELVDDLSKQLKKLDDDIKEVPELAKELNKLKKDIVTQYLKSYDIKQ